MENKRKIQQLIKQHKFNEALKVINNWESSESIELEDRLVCRILKSQVLANTGKAKDGFKLADEVLAVVRNQEPENKFLLVDAIITKVEALRLAYEIDYHYSRKKLSEYLQLLEEGEQTLKMDLNTEPQEKIERNATLQKNMGVIYRSLKELSFAEKYFQESIELYKKVEDKNRIAEVLSEVALIPYFRYDYDHELEVWKDCLKLYEELENKEGIAETLLSIARVYHYKAEPDTSSEYFEKTLQLAKKLPRTVRTATLFIEIGSFYNNYRDEADYAIDAFQKSLSISEEIDNKDGTQLSLHLLGDMYQYSKGDFKRALEYYERSQALFEEWGRKIVHAWNLTDMGNLYHLKGDLDLALIHFQKALPLFEDISDVFYFCQTFLHIGRVYRSKGEYNTALNYFEKCLKLMRELRVGKETEGLTYHEIITVMLDKQEISKAKKYFKRFTQYYEEQELIKSFLKQWFKLSEAMILKASIRIKDKARAQQLFQEVIDAPLLKLDLLNYLADPKKTAMLNLCEILLFELKASTDEITGENEVFLEVKQLLDNLASLAKQQNSFSLLVDVTILQAKLALIEGNPTLAMQLLDQAKVITEENDLQLLYKRVIGEVEYLKSQLTEWQDLIKENAPLLERLAQARLEEYITKAKKVVDLTHQ